MKCKLCELRKPRRYCPGVDGDICSICCGNEREQTVLCPLECPYLREAHDHERTPEIDPAALPNQDIQVSQQFLRDYDRVLHAVLAVVYRAAVDTRAATDREVRQAVEAVIRTYRTLATGLYYDSRPENPIAAAIYAGVREGLDTVRKMLIEKGTTPRDAEFLAILVYIEHIALARDNGRPRCRAFIESLHRLFPEYKAAEIASPLIIV